MRKKSRHLSLTYALALGAILLGLTGCKQNVSSPEAGQAAPQQNPVLPSGPGASSIPGGSPTQAGGIAWTVPTGWEPGPEHQMRVATYRIHAVAGDPEDAECAVYFFGTGQGGSVEANLARWSQQFTGPDGQAPKEAPKTDQRTVGGLKDLDLDSFRDLSGCGWNDGAAIGAEGQLPHEGRNCRGSGRLGLLQTHRTHQHGGHG